LHARDLTAIVVDVFVTNRTQDGFYWYWASPLGSSVWEGDWAPIPDGETRFPWGLPVENP